MAEPPNARAASIGQRVLSTLVTVFIAISALLGSIYLLFPLLLLLIFDPKRCRRWLDKIMGSWFTLPTALLEWTSGTKFEVRGDAIDPTKPALIIMNHRTRLDWLFLWQALYRVDDQLLQSEKITLKSALRHLPGFGWSMALDGFMFLQRQFDSDAQTVSKTVRYFAESGQPYQILWFCEGTDRTELTKERSHAFARANGLPLYEHVLHPRTTGFVYILEKMQELNYLDCVYDVTIAYSHSLVQNEPDFFLGGRAPHKVHFHIERVLPPKSRAAMGEWLQRRWAGKEAKLANFYAEEDPDKRSFKTDANQGTHELMLDQQAWRLVLVLFWTACTALWTWMLLRLPYQFTYCACVIGFYVIATMMPGGIARLFM